MFFFLNLTNHKKLGCTEVQIPRAGLSTTSIYGFLSFSNLCSRIKLQYKNWEYSNKTLIATSPEAKLMRAFLQLHLYRSCGRRSLHGMFPFWQQTYSYTLIRKLALKCCLWKKDFATASNSFISIFWLKFSKSRSCVHLLRYVHVHTYIYKNKLKTYKLQVYSAFP